MAVVTDQSALVSGQSWTGGPVGQSVILTYSFSSAPSSYLQSTNAPAAATFHPLTEEEKAVVRSDLAQWASQSGITFYETNGVVGDLTFGLYDLTKVSGSGETAGEGYYPLPGVYLDYSGTPQVTSSFQSVGGDVYFDNSYQTDPRLASDFSHVALHEIGHALGLKHPFDTPGNTLAASADNGGNTVMSYSGVRSATLGPLDIAAVQYLYGTKADASHPFTQVWNPATQALTEVGTTGAEMMFGSGGNDVFYSLGGHDAISGGEGDDTIYAAGAPISVNGGPGIDTVVTGLTYSSKISVISSGTARYIFLPGIANYQLYYDVELLSFTNGVYDTRTNTFSTQVSAAQKDPLFDAAYYMSVNKDVAASGADPYQHYMDQGWKEGRNPSALFNTNYYLSHNADVAAARVNPLLHFESNGWKEGRNPSLSFNLADYNAVNTDVRLARVNPLLHYTTVGKAEGRAAFAFDDTTNAGVDISYYYAQNADVRNAGLDATAHFLTNGWKEGRNPDAFFNTRYYLAQNADVRASGMDPLLHYEAFGWKEGRDPSAQFSTNKYLAAYTDVRGSGLNPLLHYLSFGQAEGRHTFPV